MARSLSEKPDSSLCQVIHFVGVQRFGEAQVEAAMQNALETNPQQIQNLREEAIARAQQMLAGATPQFNWGRLAIALGLLVALFGGGLYSSVHHLDDWGKVFIHSFELVLGLIIGLLGGEATAQSG